MLGATYNINGRLNRMGPLRIAFYLVCTAFLFYLLKYLSTSISTSEPFSKHKLATTAQDNESFPWYKQPHAPLSSLIQNKNLSTSHLSTTQRQTLLQEMVTQAKLAMKSEFKKIIPGTIPGSTLYASDAKGGKKFRELIDCWTGAGEWVQVKNNPNALTHVQDPLYGKCDRRFYKSHKGEEEQREAVRYIWQSKCALPAAINRDSWCKLLRGRNVLLVGDLVQYQLHELFLDSFRDGPTVCYGELSCKDHILCDGEPKQSVIRYLRNDILSARRQLDTNNGHPKADIIEWPFLITRLTRHFRIMIINRAPVVETDEEFMKGLIASIKTLRERSPGTLIIYRSTGIGHPFCDEADGPLKAPLTDKQLQMLPFGWSELARRNAIARTIVERAGGIFVDLGALSDLRPDGHIGGQDCMRYCIPGPLDSWVRILYNIFVGLETRS